MKKIKLLILYLFGWSRVSNLKYPEDEIIHKRYGYQTVISAWSLQFKNNKMKEKLNDLIHTNIFWLVFPMILGALFLLFSDNSSIFENGVHWFNYAGLICFIWPFLYTLAGIGNWMYKGIKKWKGGNK